MESKRRRPSVVTIGAFDGIHIGHRKILCEAVMLARGLRATSVVATFHPHPAKVLDGNQRPCMLTSQDEKLDLIEQTGVDETVVLRFTPKFARRSAEWFVRDILIAKLRLARLVIGYDFRFGRARQGDAAYLEALGERLGFGVDIVPPVKFMGHPVSSTRVRTALLRGEVEAAAHMLGRAYSVSGSVARGEGRGRKLTYPTANIEIADEAKMLPANGVYAVKVSLKRGTFPGVLYVGTKPTFGGKARTVEVHIMGLDDCIYMEGIRADFVGRIRGEVRFRTGDDLRRAIDRDVAEARRML